MLKFSIVKIVAVFMFVLADFYDLIKMKMDMPPVLWRDHLEKVTVDLTVNSVTKLTCEPHCSSPNLVVFSALSEDNMLSLHSDELMLLELSQGIGGLIMSFFGF